MTDEPGTPAPTATPPGEPPSGTPPAPPAAAPPAAPDDSEFSSDERVAINAARDPDAIRSVLRAARSREHAAEKVIKAAKDRQQEIDDAAKTELERERDARSNAERERDELRREKLAQSVATAAGIPEFADLLRADTKDKLEREAQALRDRVKPNRQPDLGAGSRLKNGDVATADFDDLIRRKAGYAT